MTCRLEAIALHGGSGGGGVCVCLCVYLCVCVEGNFVHLFLATFMQVSGLEPPSPSLVWQVLSPTEPPHQPHTDILIMHPMSCVQ